jgi:hypothetical protein
VGGVVEPWSLPSQVDTTPDLGGPVWWAPTDIGWIPLDLVSL